MKRIAEITMWVVAVLAVALSLTIILIDIARADPYEDIMEGYILCSDYVNVRPFANKKGEPIGRLEAGDRVFLDGKKKNGYLHIIDTGMESCDGWVHKGFVVYDEPEKMYRTATIVSKGRLAARKYVGGRRTRWLKPRAQVKVWYWSDEWCLTNCGYVQSRYLELEGE